MMVGAKWRQEMWGDRKESVSHLSCKVCHKSAKKMLGWSGYVQYALCPVCVAKLINSELKVIEVLDSTFERVLKNFSYHQYQNKQQAITAKVKKLIDNYKPNSCVFCHSQTVSYFGSISGCNEYYCQKCYNEHKSQVIVPEPAFYNCGPMIDHAGGR